MQHEQKAHWKQLQQKVKQTLGDTFWSEFSGILPYQLPRTDAFERDGSVHVYLELPGVEDAAALKISVQQQVLTVQGDIPADYVPDEDGMLLAERFVGPFQRRIPLPYRIRRDGVDAVFRSGLLKITLRKDPGDTDVVEIPVSQHKEAE